MEKLLKHWLLGFLPPVSAVPNFPGGANVGLGDTAHKYLWGGAGGVTA